MNTKAETKKKIMRATGILFISAGILCNEWLIAATLSQDGVLMSETRSFIWMFDFALIIWGVSTILFHRKKLIINVNLLFVAIMMTVLLIEVALRISPRILGREFANGVLTKYSVNQEGIYFLGANCQGSVLNLMKPNFKTTMYYNGYRWLHETDEFGFRNLGQRKEAEVLLLGDSFIYGHGVNIDQTVAYFLESSSKHSVVNLARQGDSAFQEAFLLGQYIAHYKPRYVFYFFYENDITDLYLYLTKDEIKEFIESPIEEIPDCLKDSLPHEQYSEQTSKTIKTKASLKPYVWRLYDWLSSRRKLNEIIKKTMKPAETAKGEKKDSKLGNIFTKERDFSYYVSLGQVSAAGPKLALYSADVDEQKDGRNLWDAATGQQTVLARMREENHGEEEVTRQMLSDNDNPDALGWRYTTKAILKMRYISQLHGATFVIVPITPKNKKHFQILEDIAGKHKILFIDTSIIDESESSMFLENDGHFSEKGARTMAELVSSFLYEQKRI